MRNPFEELMSPRLVEPTGEEVDGTFGCQTEGCFRFSGKARYIREVDVLTWICQEGHINKIEGFEID